MSETRWDYDKSKYYIDHPTKCYKCGEEMNGRKTCPLCGEYGIDYDLVNIHTNKVHKRVFFQRGIENP